MELKFVYMKVNGHRIQINTEEARKLIGITATNALLEERCAENVKKETSASTTMDF